MTVTSPDKAGMTLDPDMQRRHRCRGTGWWPVAGAGRVVVCVVLLALFGTVGVRAQVAPNTPVDLEEKLPNSSEYQNRRMDAENALSLARSAVGRRRFDQARQLIVKAMRIYNLHGMTDMVARSYALLGFLDIEENRGRRAVELFRNSLVQYRKSLSYQEMGQMAGVIGLLHSRFGENGLACVSWDSAFQFFVKSGNDLLSERTLALIVRQGCPEAVHHLAPEVAFPPPGEVEADAEAIDSLLGLQSVEVDEEEVAAAVRPVGRGLVTEEDQRVLDALRADALRNNARELVARADDGEAIVVDRLQDLGEALAIFRRLRDDDEIIGVLGKIGSMLLRADEPLRAQDNFDEAIEMIRARDRLYPLAAATFEAAREMMTAGLYDVAMAYADDSVRYNSLAEQVGEREEVLRFIAVNAMEREDDDRYCRAAIHLLEDLDQAERTTDVIVLIAEIATRPCPVPSGPPGSFDRNYDANMLVLVPLLAQFRAVERQSGGSQAENDYLHRLAAIARARADYILTDKIYNDLVESHAMAGSYREVEDILDILIAVSEQAGASGKVEEYRLRKRTARLDVIHRDTSANELGNLGIDAAQEGDTEIACYFWQRARDSYATENRQDLIELIASLESDYGC